MDVTPAEEKLASGLVEGGELAGARLVAIVEEEQRALARTLRLHAAALLEHLRRKGVSGRERHAKACRRPRTRRPSHGAGRPHVRGTARVQRRRAAPRVQRGRECDQHHVGLERVVGGERGGWLIRGVTGGENRRTSLTKQVSGQPSIP